MATFNSLGSNYSWRFVWRCLLAGRSRGASTKLSQLLGQHYGGQANLTYKGREALEIALKNSGLPTGSAIGINGFTCYAVYCAVENAGFKALPIDVASGQLNFGLAELKDAHHKDSALKAIIIQNTLGYPADIAEFVGYCQQAGLLIIEDLAHSTGLVYSDGNEAGTVGAFTMLSFSQDKPLDVVAGGAVIDRHRQKVQSAPKLPVIGVRQRLKNRLYPFWSALIRTTYPIGIGRYLHFALKKTNLMATPMSDDLEGLHRMTDTTAKLVIERWQQLSSELSHRREIAAIYNQKLPVEIILAGQTETKPTYLRFAVRVEQRQSLINYLGKHQIFIGDTWYDAPIGPKKYLANTNYTVGTCPNSEELAEHIVNLPTHLNVTSGVATDICAKIKQWQASQQKL